MKSISKSNNSKNNKNAPKIKLNTDKNPSELWLTSEFAYAQHNPIKILENQSKPTSKKLHQNCEQPKIKSLTHIRNCIKIIKHPSKKWKFFKNKQNPHPNLHKNHPEAKILQDQIKPTSEFAESNWS